MTEITQWIVAMSSLLITIISLIVPLYRAKKDKRFLISSLKILKEANDVLSEKLNDISSRSELLLFHENLKKGIIKAMDRDKNLKDIESKPKVKKNLADAFGIDQSQHSYKREGWQYFIDWRVGRRSGDSSIP